jgi:hypothetical protein
LISIALLAESKVLEEGCQLVGIKEVERVYLQDLEIRGAGAVYLPE